MESMRKQHTLAQHPLVPRCKLNFRDGKRMAQVQASIHVWVWKISEPFRVFRLDFRGGEAS